MDLKIALIGLVGLMGLYLVGTVLVRPLRYLIRVAAWALIGVFLLAVINTVFGHCGLHIAINPVTVLTAGVLQVPGVLLLVLVNYFIL